ncbi:MAG: hypothetical protein LUD72_08765 [Bacteroidales bacterium]|nr:hypothetical protein [Bacteroidales bacterium]
MNKNWKVDAAVKNLGKLLYDDEYGYHYIVGGKIKAVFESDSVCAKVGERYVPFQNDISIRMDFDSLMSGLDTVFDIVLYSDNQYCKKNNEYDPYNSDLIRYNVTHGVKQSPGDVERVFPKGFVVELRLQDSAIGMIKPSVPPYYYGQSVSAYKIGGDDVYVPNVTGNKYLVKYEFADLSAVKEFLNRNVYVSLVPEPKWIKIAEPDIFNITVGDSLYFKGKGSCELLEIFDQPNTELVKIRFADGEESSLRIIDNLILLPTFSVEESPLLKEINRAYREQLLSPCVVSDGDTYNVYWFLIDDAAAYHVVLYKNVPRPHKQGLMRIKDYTLDRHTGYLAVPNLVGKNFVFKVYAEDRDGSVLSESRGILDTGEPTEMKE